MTRRQNQFRNRPLAFALTLLAALALAFAACSPSGTDGGDGGAPPATSGPGY
jgi:hypothetical protein